MITRRRAAPVDFFATVLAENATGWERGNPDIAAVLVAEDAVGKTPAEMVLLGQPVAHGIDRLLVVVRQIDEQWVLALRDFRAQPVANRDEIVLGDVEPLIALEEAFRSRIWYVAIATTFFGSAASSGSAFRRSEDSPRDRATECQ